MEQEESILIDDNSIPIAIDSLEEFTKNVHSTYFVASNKYLMEYNKLKQNRSVQGIMDL